MRYTPTTTIQPDINIPEALAEITERFAKALPVLGYQNERGTYRRQYEEDFMYLQNDLHNGPRYMAVKKLEQMVQLTATLVKMGKLARNSNTAAPVAA